MQTQTKAQNKLPASLAPLIAFIVCFIVIIFSINQIIDMAKSKPIKPKNEQYNYVPVNALIQSSSPINYKEFETKLSEFSTHKPTLQAEFNIDPQIERLPANEQNYLIRLKLIEWKVGRLQDQISQTSSTSSESLIFKSWFWFYSLLIWAGSITGGQILTFYTNKLILKYLGSS